MHAETALAPGTVPLMAAAGIEAPLAPCESLTPMPRNFIASRMII